MALDEAICESVRNKKSGVCIRFYSWNPNAISIGHFQGLTNEVNLEECEKQGVSVVRRRTGGGAVYHDREGEITYSVIGPEEFFPDDLEESYKFVCEPIINALKKIGIDAVFKPVNDLLVDDKKISGNAQTRKKGVFLQHGTILVNVNVEKMFSLLKAGQSKTAEKLIQSVKKMVTCTSNQTKKSKEELLIILEEEYAKHFFNNEYEVSDYTEEEIKRAKELAKTLYQTKEWNYQR